MSLREKASPPFALFPARVAEDYIQPRRARPRRLWDKQLFLAGIILPP
jgi:hypothetical protein